MNIVCWYRKTLNNLLMLTFLMQQNAITFQQNQLYNVEIIINVSRKTWEYKEFYFYFLEEMNCDMKWNENYKQLFYH